MVRSLLKKGSDFFTRRQTGVLSAAAIIMFMVVASRVLGLVRNRVLAHYFLADQLSVYFAAFRLPEVIFEVLVFGALSAALIPTFTAYISKKQEKEAWYVAATSLNLAFLVFIPFALLIFLFAHPLYRILAPGFADREIAQIASLTRILIWAQGFFVVSYFLTGVLESFRRFLVPAIAPLFYNIGIIIGTIFLSPSLGIYAPTLGALLGAFLHFLIQLPLAIYLGFRPCLGFDFRHKGVKEVGRLALPRVVELSFLQIAKSAELFLASLVSTAAYTHYLFANSVQLLPIGLFGVSIAKASLPTLSYHSARGEKSQFNEVFSSLFRQILFLVIPASVFLVVLRIPIVRLIFGTARFSWESTLQTSYALSAFALGIFAQALIYLLARAFYALHDTLTPVKISIAGIMINVVSGAILVIGLGFPIWGLALAYTLSAIFQFFLLSLFLFKRLPEIDVRGMTVTALKIIISAGVSGTLMYLLLKIFDLSVWNKNLWFLAKAGLTLPTSFDRFVLDTRYTVNLLLLTLAVALVGIGSYLFLSWLFKIQELSVLVSLLGKLKKTPLEPVTITNGGQS